MTLSNGRFVIKNGGKKVASSSFKKKVAFALDRETIMDILGVSDLHPLTLAGWFAESIDPSRTVTGYESPSELAQEAVDTFGNDGDWIDVPPEDLFEAILLAAKAYLDQVQEEEEEYGRSSSSSRYEEGATYRKGAKEFEEGFEDDFEEDEEFSPSEEDAYVKPTGNLGGLYSLSVSGKHLGNFVEWDEVEEALREWTEQNNYYPNLWIIDDHGGMEGPVDYSLDVNASGSNRFSSLKTKELTMQTRKQADYEPYKELVRAINFSGDRIQVPRYLIENKFHLGEDYPELLGIYSDKKAKKYCGDDGESFLIITDYVQFGSPAGPSPDHPFHFDYDEVHTDKCFCDWCKESGGSYNRYSRLQKKVAAGNSEDTDQIRTALNEESLVEAITPLSEILLTKPSLTGKSVVPLSKSLDRYSIPNRDRDNIVVKISPLIDERQTSEDIFSMFDYYLSSKMGYRLTDRGPVDCCYRHDYENKEGGYIYVVEDSNSMHYSGDEWRDYYIWWSRYGESGKEKLASLKTAEGTENDTDQIRIYIADLSAYNAGRLVGQWVDLPVDEDELKAIVGKLSRNFQQDWAIHDYEAPFTISEHDDVFKLNEMVEKAEDLGVDWEVMGCIKDYGVCANNDDWDCLFEAYENAQVIDVSDYEGSRPASPEKNLGFYYVDEVYGGIENVSPETLEMYFDYEQFGRDMSMESLDEEDQERYEQFSNDQEYGKSLVEDFGGVREATDHPEYYFDYESYGRDLAMDYYLCNGKTYVRTD